MPLQLSPLTRLSLHYKERHFSRRLVRRLISIASSSRGCGSLNKRIPTNRLDSSTQSILDLPAKCRGQETNNTLSTYLKPSFPRYYSTMAYTCHGTSNHEMVSKLWNAHIIRYPIVRDAMLQVDRGNYSPRDPYKDSPQSIGYDATISAPHIHSHSISMIAPNIGPNSRVLDVGCGSGYVTHVLANLIRGEDKTPAESPGFVVGIDHVPELVEFSIRNVSKSEQGRQYLEAGKIRFVTGDGRKGYSECAPYDAIHVGAAALELHEELVDQLAAPGAMYIPVEDPTNKILDVLNEQYVWEIKKDEKGNVSKNKLFAVHYVSLLPSPPRIR